MSITMRLLLVVAVVVGGGVVVARIVDPDLAGRAAAVVDTPAPASAPAASAEIAVDTVASSVAPAPDDAAAVDLVAVAAVELSPYLSSFCPSTVHAAVVDRDRQRAWLCDDGVAVHELVFTGAVSQPDPGTYPVYAKDLESSSSTSAGTSTMTHFVAFTYGKFRGARIAFHSVPIATNGDYVQPLDSVGDPARRGESAGCLRVLPDDAVRVWDWLAIGDEVRVIN